MSDDFAGFKFQVSGFKLEFQVSQAERRLGYALAIMSHTFGAYHRARAEARDGE